jgi:hypothetical protein
MSDEERRKNSSDLVKIITDQNAKISDLTGKIIFETGKAITEISTTLKFMQKEITEIKVNYEKINTNTNEITGIKKSIKLGTYILGVLFTAAVAYAMAMASVK